MGLGAFSFDWDGILAYHGSPLVTPWVSILNVIVGFVIFIYIIIPLYYWKYNLFGSRKFPIFSSKLFSDAGKKYDITHILTQQYNWMRGIIKSMEIYILTLFLHFLLDRGLQELQQLLHMCSSSMDSEFPYIIHLLLSLLL